MEAIKVLIVDDSLLFREVVSRGLKSRLPAGSQVEKAGDPFVARDKILSLEPDVMVLDAEMPNMNGIEFLRRMIAQYNLPTVVSSSRSAYKDLAMEAGAFSFLAKPFSTLGSGAYLDTLAAEVKRAKEHSEIAARQARPKHVGTRMNAAQVKNLVRQYDARTDKQDARYEGMEAAKEAVKPQKQSVNAGSTIELIAIGASTGGTEALSKVLKALLPPLPPIVIVQHIPPMFSKLFADRLHDECRITVKEAENGDRLEPNFAYVAPGDKQMRVKKLGGVMQLDVNPGARVNGHCPSVDVLFDSVAAQIGDKALGVILTGMGADGAKGLLHMRQRGAATLGQNQATCVVYGMPRAAYELGAVQKQLPLNDIAAMITNIATRQGRH